MESIAWIFFGISLVGFLFLLVNITYLRNTEVWVRSALSVVLIASVFSMLLGAFSCHAVYQSACQHRVLHPLLREDI